MKNTYSIRMRLFILALLGIAGFVFAPSVSFGGWVGETMCACPGLAKPLGNNASCEDACYGIRSSPGGGNATPSYDYGAAQRAREAEAERQRQAEAEADRLERERLAEEKRRKDAKFISDRDAAANTLKGSASPAMNQLKGLSGTDSIGLKGSGFDTGTGLKELRGSDAAPHTATSVVDARNVPTGLPKSIEESIPGTPAGDRVRKGFQAIAEHDWKVALAWFQDALNHEPGSPGIRRLVDLAQYTLQRQSEPIEKSTVAATATKVKSDKAKTGVNEELDRSLNDYYKKYPPKFLKFIKPGKDIQSDTEWLNEKEPAWKKFFRLFTPKFKVKEDGAVIWIGIRG